MTKTIIISDGVYRKLKYIKEKENKNFREVVDALIERRTKNEI